MRGNDSITDRDLIQLFHTIGFDILSDDPKLFFTNLVMGYRLQGTSGGFKSAWANADAPFFRRLVVVLNLRKIQHTLSRLFGRILHFLLPQQKLVFVQ